MNHNPTYTDVPVFISWTFYGTIENPESYWSCQDYIDWHKSCKSNLSKASADKLFVTAWTKYTRPIFEKVPHLCATNNPDFISYFKKEGLIDQTGNMLASLVGGEIKLADTVSDVVLTTGGAAIDVVKGAGEFISGASKMLKYLPYVLLGLLVVVGIIFALNYSQKRT